MTDKNPEPLTLRWSWLIRDMTFQERWHEHALLRLAAHAGRDNVADPGLEKFASAIGISTKQLGRFLKACHLAGIVEVKPRKGRKHGESKHRTNHYTLTFPRVEAFIEGTIHVVVDEGRGRHARAHKFWFALPGNPIWYLPAEQLAASYFITDDSELGWTLDPSAYPAESDGTQISRIAG